MGCWGERQETRGEKKSGRKGREGEGGKAMGEKGRELDAAEEGSVTMKEVL